MARARSRGCVHGAFAVMQPFLASGRCLNYLGDREEGDPVAAVFGPNYARLRQVKAAWDPDNVSHMNQNVRPSA
jgi:hypothetical protein